MAEKRSRFEQIYRQQTQAGEGTFSAIGTAARERARERADLRRMFPNTGMLGAMLESAFGKPYRAGSKAGKAGQVSGASPLDDKSLNVIRMNTAIMAKNSMVLPGMARDMNVMRQNITRLTKHTTGSAATRADAHFLKAKERESAYESAIDKGSDKKSAVGKVAGGASNLFKSLFGGIGSFLGGTLAIGGSIISSLVSGLGSVLGIVGGVAGSILGAVGSAIGGLGIMGIIALAGAGYMISQMNKSGMFDDLSLGKMFGLAPRTDGKGLFEDTANKLDKFMNTDLFSSTLHEIKGTFAGLAAASLKLFENLSNLIGNFIDLALLEIKQTFMKFSVEGLSIIGGVMGAKAGLSVAQLADLGLDVASLAAIPETGGASAALRFGTKGALKLGAKKLANRAMLGGAGLGIGAYLGSEAGGYFNKKIAEDYLSEEQKVLLQEIEANRGNIQDFLRVESLRQESLKSGIPLNVTTEKSPTGAGNIVRMEGMNIESFNRMNILNERYKKSFGESLFSDKNPTDLAMQMFKAQKIKNIKDVNLLEGVSNAFSEYKELYTSPTKASNLNVMPTKANQSDMANLIRRRFLEAGFTPEQAQAAVVNAFAESTLNPSAHVTTAKEDSVGLFMANRKGGLGEGYTVEQLQDPNFNIDLAIQQAKKSQAFGKAGTISEAIAAFVRDVERPANMEEQVSKRIALANEPLESAVNQNTEAVNNLNKNLEAEKESTFTEILAALLEGMAASTTGTTVNNVNNTSVSGGGVASPYNEDMVALFKNRATQGF